MRAAVEHKLANYCKPGVIALERNDARETRESDHESTGGQQDLVLVVRRLREEDAVCAVGRWSV